jgi:hypothetical protein
MWRGPASETPRQRTARDPEPSPDHLEKQSFASVETTSARLTMSLAFADSSYIENTLVTEREPFASFTTYHDDCTQRQFPVTW